MVVQICRRCWDVLSVMHGEGFERRYQDQERLNDLIIGPYWGTYGIVYGGFFNLCWDLCKNQFAKTFCLAGLPSMSIAWSLIAFVRPSIAQQVRFICFESS